MVDCFTYWEGDQPEYIARCLRSLERSCQRTRFHLVTPHTLANYIDTTQLPENFAKLTEPAHRADYLRAALLAQHGGFWFDADTVGLQDPADLADNVDLLYCVWSNQPRRVLNGYVYAQPGSALARQWLEALNARLIDHAADAPWTALGEGILTPLVDAAPTTTRQVERTVFLPIDVDNNVRAFALRQRPEYYLQAHSVCFGLNHSFFWANFREWLEPKPADPRGRLLQQLLARYTH